MTRPTDKSGSPDKIAARKAQLLTQRANEAREAVADAAKLKLAEAAKTARLRELRLAKEASDQAAAVLEKPKPKANSAGVRRKPSRSAS